VSLFDHIKNESDSLEPLNADDLSVMTAPEGGMVDVAEPKNNPNEIAQELKPHAAGRQYSVGIDLGTTHCVLSYVDITDIEEGEYVQQVLAIPQLTSPGLVEESYQWPSFL